MVEPASKTGDKVLPRLALSTNVNEPTGATTPDAINEPISRTIATLEWHPQVNAAASNIAYTGSPPNDPNTARNALALSTGSNVCTNAANASNISRRPIPTQPRFLPPPLVRQYVAARNI